MVVSQMSRMLAIATLCGLATCQYGNLLTREEPATRNIAGLLPHVEGTLKKLTGLGDKLQQLRAISYKSESLHGRGTIYFVKVSWKGKFFATFGESYAVLRIVEYHRQIYTHLDGYLFIHTRDTPITYVPQGLRGLRPSGPHTEGNLSPERPADAEVIALVSEVKEQAFGKRSGSVSPLSYQTQITNGVVYYVKVTVGIGTSIRYATMRIFVSLSGDVKLEGYEYVRPHSVQAGGKELGVASFVTSPSVVTMGVVVVFGCVL